MIRWRPWAALLAVAVFAPVAAAQDGVARVESGELQGKVDAGVARFLGVPYAAPPVGDWRWAAPQLPLPWAGRRAATAHAPGCVQLVTPDGFGPWTREYMAPAPVSEDCLTANIWTPVGRAAKPRPMLVWIHGGAFMSGSNAVPIYDGSALARQGIVVVSVNYRLGVFGFAGFREAAGEGANFGLQDILASLRWVRRNAAGFGGDPARVTIAGQSAGAMAVHMLLASPASDGLFSQAIAQSGVIEAPLPTREDGLRRGDDLKARAGVRTLAELRGLPADRILALLASGPLAGTASVGGGALIGPVVDGAILPDQLSALEAQGKRKPVPVMVGLNADEGVLTPDYFQSSPAALAAGVEKAVGAAKANRLLAGYRIDDDAAALAASRAITRLYGVASVIDWAKAYRGPLFAYYFTHPEPGPMAATFGAFHSAEIPYVFDTLDASPTRNFVEKDRQIAATMSRYWANFVTSGDPNAADLPRWPRFDRGRPAVMELGGAFAPYRADGAKFDLLLDWIAKGQGRSILGITSTAPADNKDL